MKVSAVAEVVGVEMVVDVGAEGVAGMIAIQLIMKMQSPPTMGFLEGTEARKMEMEEGLVRGVGMVVAVVVVSEGVVAVVSVMGMLLMGNAPVECLNVVVVLDVGKCFCNAIHLALILNFLFFYLLAWMLMNFPHSNVVISVVLNIYISWFVVWMTAMRLSVRALVVETGAPLQMRLLRELLLWSIESALIDLLEQR